mmetsp:Transcript_13865/g.18959  ORF Transcript_13865/g.18959 Transcript_13865/m.18959 type:complete len:360 (-) Transcript_13865:868-1947(-)
MLHDGDNTLQEVAVQEVNKIGKNMIDSTAGSIPSAGGRVEGGQSAQLATHSVVRHPVPCRHHLDPGLGEALKELRIGLGTVRVEPHHGHHEVLGDPDVAGRVVVGEVHDHVALEGVVADGGVAVDVVVGVARGAELAVDAVLDVHGQTRAGPEGVIEGGGVQREEQRHVGVEIDEFVLTVVDLVRCGSRRQLVVGSAIHVDPDVLVAQLQVLREDGGPRHVTELHEVVVIELCGRGVEGVDGDAAGLDAWVAPVARNAWVYMSQRVGSAERDGVGVGEAQLDYEGLRDGIHAVLRIRVSPNAFRAAGGCSAAVLEGEADSLRGVGLLHHQLAEEHPEVGSADGVAELLVDGLQRGHDGR